jgi:hypothetical protein
MNLIVSGPSRPSRWSCSRSARCYCRRGIYRLHHPARGALDLFMVPLGPDACGMRYEIVFN